MILAVCVGPNACETAPGEDCNNHGVCESVGGSTCICDAGFSGTLCSEIGN